jgi:HAMP domain-containing protein
LKKTIVRIEARIIKTSIIMMLVVILMILKKQTQQRLMNLHTIKRLLKQMKPLMRPPQVTPEATSSDEDENVTTQLAPRV